MYIDCAQVDRDAEEEDVQEAEEEEITVLDGIAGSYGAYTCIQSEILPLYTCIQCKLCNWLCCQLTAVQCAVAMCVGYANINTNG